MKKNDASRSLSEMKAEYDFSDGTRGKYARAYADGTNVIVLDPDVAAVFPDSKAVNEALRVIVRAASKSIARGGKAPAAGSRRKAG
jgi:ABC-type tungstate transport system permease subunit